MPKTTCHAKSRLVTHRRRADEQRRLKKQTKQNIDSAFVFQGLSMMTTTTTTTTTTMMSILMTKQRANIHQNSNGPSCLLTALNHVNELMHSYTIDYLAFLDALRSHKIDSYNTHEAFVRVC